MFSSFFRCALLWFPTEIAAQPLTGIEVKERACKVQFKFWKKRNDSKKKRKKCSKGKVAQTESSKVNISKVEKNTWKKKSIFFELEYWEHLVLRHNLDVMHIEKNICHNIISTLLNIPEKMKDGVKACLDLLEMGVERISF